MRKRLNNLAAGALLVLSAFSRLAGAELPPDFFKHFHYREIGPTRQGGRVVSFAVSHQDPFVYFVGAGPGGVWKTVNNGNSFEPVFDNERTSSIGHVAVAPSDQNIVWVGTGEANLRNSTYYGDGIYKSTDGGKRWMNMGLRNTQHIGKVIIHPTNPDIVYVAAQGQYYSDNEERGVYRTTDGGRTWRKVLGVKDGTIHVGATDLVMDPRDPDVLYAASYERIRRPWGFSGAGPASGIYKTSDKGDTWIKLSAGLPGGLLGRIGLAIYLRNPDILYAVIEDANVPGMPYEERWDEIQKCKPSAKPTVGNTVYRSDDAGKSWRRVSKGNVGERANYYGQIVVDPNDENTVYVLGEKVDVSRDGGKTWSKAFEYGGDNHVLWIDPRDSRHMLLGYDYGFARSYDSGRNWLHFDNISLAQLYAIGVDMEFPYNVYGGMQDFGSWKGPSAKKGRFPIRFEDWEHVRGGDGAYCQVDPTDSRWLYCESQFGDLGRNDQKTGQREEIRYTGNHDLRFNWCAPILVSPHNPDVIYHGANLLLRSRFRGESWEAVSPDLTKNDPAKVGCVESSQYGTITTMDESPLRPGVIWVGTDDGNVQLTRDGGKTWTRLNDRIPDNPEYWVTRVISSRHNEGSAYVTFTGRHRADFRPFVYRTDDFGMTWTSIAGNLPDEPVNVIREDPKNPDLLFLGTDRTVYVSLDRGVSWHDMKNNLPTIPVNDLVIHPREKDLVVGTFGRGFYITDISPLEEMTREVLDSDGHLFRIKPKIQWIMPSQKAVADQNFAGENEPLGVKINYYLRKDVPGGVKISVYEGPLLIDELEGPAHKGLNFVLWGMTKRGRKKTPDQVAKWDEEVAKGEREPYYDYYDTNEYFGDPEEEVGRTGLSLRTRVAWQPGMRGRDYAYMRVRPGTYTVKLSAAGKTLTQEAEIIQDYWYDKQ